MQTRSIRIHAGGGYNVTIGQGLLSTCGDLIQAKLHPCHVAVITDSNVGPLYLDRVQSSLLQAGLPTDCFTFPAGEGSKTMETFSKICEFLAAVRLTRTDCVIALGGGVVGDVTGFAAGCYLRGIPYVQLPTTLLAAVDSSVGGKTAVDLTAGKNLAGVFHQPSAVLCDVSAFHTLPEAAWKDGLAEALKTGVLAGEELFSLLEDGAVQPLLPEIIAKCVAYKGGIVDADETEQGVRKLLNLGHTPGHAVELISGYRISHGYAVSIGMGIMTRAAMGMGLCSVLEGRRILSALNANHLPTECPYTAKQLAEAALSDKKRSGQSVTLILPEAVGRCVMQTHPVDDLASIFALGMEVY